ncbi:MAG: cellulase [Clostridia bacterium]|nr:cellulase [Clostridia bacterium]
MDIQICEKIKTLFNIDKPFTIAMWDFSWIERRWPGAGYEDWDQALNELTERGYDAVRIDPYPHLMDEDAHAEWTLKPVWSVHNWGSSAILSVTLYDNLREFLRACRRHGVRVALSSWFREDMDNTRMRITTPTDHAAVWIKTLDYIRTWGELDNILFVDMCNGFPHKNWSPFFSKYYGSDRSSAHATFWMREVIGDFKKAYPQIPATFSFSPPFVDVDEDVSYLDFIEPHIWMTNSSGFYDKVGYHFELFYDIGYTNLALNGERTYRENKEYYDNCLREEIWKIAEWSRRSGKPIVTTECWSVVDYKDWPMLNWDWILEINSLGIKTAADTGRWAGMATSNFCGPQLVGMWREKKWHQKMTKIIHNSNLQLMFLEGREADREDSREYRNENGSENRRENRRENVIKEENDHLEYVR